MVSSTAAKHGRGRLSRAIGVGSVLVLLLTGCGADDAPDAPAAEADGGAEEGAEVAQTQAPETDDDAAAEAQDDAASGQLFVDAFEAEGLECAASDPDLFGPGGVEQFVCQGQDHLVMTIRGYEDDGARDEQLDRIQGLACEIADQGQEVQRVTDYTC